MRLLEQPLFIGIIALGQARRLTVAQQIERTAQNNPAGFGFLIALRAFFDEVGDALFKALKVGQHQLGLDGLRVGNRIDFVIDMLDIVILKTAQHMRSEERRVRERV